ncbi:hypothetical protein Ccrd_000385 [Cynara cardunculus var. scolymus]|uniref:Uncharacterized protein n=1 Tax=Cynara cardunculus var. scolymus TaxID=59895 RepID=A0A103XV63_CYNCS|nr:hypothetical protein Ccrd_000385 [Cynara cardunculus var. scolymus]
MAALSSSKSQYVSWKLFVVLFFTALLVGQSSATSRGNTMMPLKHHPRKYDANPGLFFSMLPKGKRVPPSGPSKRHNSVVNSTPNN